MYKRWFLIVVMLGSLLGFVPKPALAQGPGPQAGTTAKIIESLVRSGTLKQVRSDILVDVATQTGRLKGNWMKYLQTYYLRYGWELVKSPYQAGGRWVVLLTRWSFVAKGMPAVSQESIRKLCAQGIDLGSACPKKWN